MTHKVDFFVLFTLAFLNCMISYNLNFFLYILCTAISVSLRHATTAN